MAPIAVITVTFSPGRHLRRFLDSSPAAAAQGTRVLMVDNGSTDGSVEEAAASGDAELLYSGGNIGYGAAMNVGFRHLRSAWASGEIDPEFFLIVNPDVVFREGAIDELIAAARRYPRAAAVGPRIAEPDGGVYPSAREIPRLSLGIGHALLGPVWPNNPWTRRYQKGSDMTQERRAGWLSGSCMLLRREAFDSVGGFDERYFMYMEDVDLCDRLGRAGWLNIYTPDAVISHAQGHSASKHPEITIPAHHASAYRFQADRLPGWKFFPIRAALKVGLALREKIAVVAARPALRTLTRREN